LQFGLLDQNGPSAREPTRQCAGRLDLAEFCYDLRVDHFHVSEITARSRRDFWDLPFATADCGMEISQKRLRVPTFKG